MNAVSLITSLRVAAAAVAGALVALLFLDGPVGPVLTTSIPFWNPFWMRAFLFAIVLGIAVLASLREHRRLLIAFVVIAFLLVVPSVYPFSSIDWVRLLTGAGPASKVSSPQAIISLELVLLTLCLLAVFYLGWLRRLLLDSEGQGVDAGDLNALTRLNLRFLAVFLGVAGGCGLVAALFAGNAAKPLLDLTSRLPLAVPILGLGASLALAAALFLGLSQRSPER